MGGNDGYNGNRGNPPKNTSSGYARLWRVG